MDSRRKFLKASAAALAVAATRPIFGAGGMQGASDRVRMAIIGAGNRGGRVFDSFMRQKDCQFLAAAEVNKAQSRPVDDPGPPDLQARCRQRLPPPPRPPRHRCRPDCHARPRPRPSDGRRHLGRQGRLRREAGLQHGGAHQCDARRLQEGQAGRPGRHPAAELGSLHRGQEAARQRRASATSRTSRSCSPARMPARRKRKQPVPPGLDWDLFQGPATRRPFKPSRLGVPGLVRIRRRAGRRLGRPSRRRGPVVHECRPQGADPDDGRGAFLAVPDADPERCPTRSRSPGSTTTSSCPSPTGGRENAGRQSRAGETSSSATAPRCRSTAWDGAAADVVRRSASRGHRRRRPPAA